MPFLPPGRLTRLLLRIRALLGRTHRAMAPPPLQILEAMLPILDNRVISILDELGIPDLLDAPRDVNDLASATATDPGNLNRLLRYAAARRLLFIDDDGRYRSGALIAAIRSDQVNPWHGWVRMVGSDWFWSALRKIDEPLRDQIGRAHV